jgi:hypothetical protein
MNVTLGLASLSLFFHFGEPLFHPYAQDPPAQSETVQRPRQGEENGQRPLIGKITSIHEGALELTDVNGNSITVRLTGKTEFRKDRNPAKLADFKVGDFTLVRGPRDRDGNVTAEVVATRSGQGGPGGAMRGGQVGTLGKDFVVGEVKSIDAPKLTVARPDGVTQTIELNEETSLRRGRESITMADIQPGDHVIARGGMENGVFVPKGLAMLGPEQWQRMQEMGVFGQSGANKQKPNQPQTSQPNPPESPH